MPDRHDLSNRRSVLQGAGATVLAGALAGPLTTTSQAAQDKELHLYGWEGYNSDRVLDPFRKEFDATVKAELLTSDPEAVNQLRSGGSFVWDLITVNNPWARRMMWPQGLIRALPRDRFGPYYEKMLPAFRLPYKWALDESGTHLLGMAQRFGPFSFVVNTDKISRALAEDQGFKLFLDRRLRRRYGLLTYRNWNVSHICIAADINPFTPHKEKDFDRFGKMARRIVDGAKVLSGDFARLNEALIKGEIDAYFTGGTYTASPARLSGARNIRGITPNSGPIDGKGGILWTEISSLVKNPEPTALAESFLEYVQRPEIAKRVAFAADTHNPVTQMGDARVLAKFSKDELDAIQWDSLEAELSNCADYDINPTYLKMLARYTAAVSERAG